MCARLHHPVPTHKLQPGLSSSSTAQPGGPSRHGPHCHGKTPLNMPDFDGPFGPRWSIDAKRQNISRRWVNSSVPMSSSSASTFSVVFHTQGCTRHVVENNISKQPEIVAASANAVLPNHIKGREGELLTIVHHSLHSVAAR